MSLKYEPVSLSLVCLSRPLRARYPCARGCPTRVVLPGKLWEGCCCCRRAGSCPISQLPTPPLEAIKVRIQNVGLLDSYQSRADLGKPSASAADGRVASLSRVGRHGKRYGRDRTATHQLPPTATLGRVAVLSWLPRIDRRLGRVSSWPSEVPL